MSAQHLVDYTKEDLHIEGLDVELDMIGKILEDACDNAMQRSIGLVFATETQADRAILIEKTLNILKGAWESINNTKTYWQVNLPNGSAIRITKELSQ